MIEHTNLINQTLIDASKLPGTRLWSNPSGMGYMGSVVNRSKDSSGNTYITIKNPRVVKYGLCPGSLDMVGFKTVDNKPIYTEIDAKVGKDKLSVLQKKRIDMIRKFGGFAGVVKKEGDIQNFFRDHPGV